MRDDAEDAFELDPANVHPRAAAVMVDDFWWDCVDATAPFGNDTGADTLAFYRQWYEHNPNGNPLEFLSELIEGWEVDDSHKLSVDTSTVQQRLDADTFSLMTFDEAAIATAFAEVLIRGDIDQGLRQLALVAIERQALNPCISLFVESAQEDRAARLARMREVLENWSE